MNNVFYAEINAEEEGQRLDNYLLRILKGVPKSHIYCIIRSGEVRVNKKRAKPSLRLSCGDQIRVPPIRMTTSQSVFVGDKLKEQLQACVIYEDDALMVINKPSGVAVHGGSGLSLGVIEAFREIRADLPYLELVHRLDKETSGCLLLAKKRSLLRSIQAQFEARKVKKVYWALLTDAWQGQKKRVVEAPLEKNTRSCGERHVTVDESGKASQTEFELLENYKQACWVSAMPKTGRTHQIRVHAAYIGHPIIGDQKYGEELKESVMKTKKNRLYLHARAIQFNLNGAPYFFQSELDEGFLETIKQLREV